MYKNFIAITVGRSSDKSKDDEGKDENEGMETEDNENEEGKRGDDDGKDTKDEKEKGKEKPQVNMDCNLVFEIDLLCILM